VKKNISILAITMGSGGAERVISRFLEPLTKDFNVHLVLLYDIVHYEIPSNVKKHIILPGRTPSDSIFRKLTDLGMTVRSYTRFIKHENIDVAVSFLTLPNIVNGITSMRFKHLKTIISERCYPSLMYKYNKLSLLFAKVAFPLFYNRNTKLFSNSVHINKDLKTNFGVKIPMSVIYNPIDITGEKKNINLEAIPNEFKLINVGSLYGPKNQELILKSLTNLKTDDYSLTILGDGAFRNQLESYSKQNELNHIVSFKGKVNNVKERLLMHDCFILSSNNEGFPNVLLEAMSVGLPVISTNCLSGPLELLNNNEDISIPKGGFAKAKFGLMVNVKDAEGLTKAIEYYKDNTEERIKYGDLSYSRAKDYELSSIYPEFKKLIVN